LLVRDVPVADETQGSDLGHTAPEATRPCESLSEIYLCAKTATREDLDVRLEVELVNPLEDSDSNPVRSTEIKKGG
jgi:hypothetical protein